jgi:hypothetical protein
MRTGERLDPLVMCVEPPIAMGRSGARLASQSIK